MNNTRYEIRWVNRTGPCSTRTFADLAAAANRLAYLDKVEDQTRRCMPTDSGGVRFSYQTESEAIRDLLSKRTTGDVVLGRCKRSIAHDEWKAARASVSEFKAANESN